MTEQKKLTPTQEKVRKKKLVAIKADLQSSEEVVVLDALKKVRKDGDASVVEYLVHTLVTTDSEAIQGEVVEILNTLKDSEAVEPLIDAIKDPKTKGYRNLLISAFWQAGLNVKGHLEFLVLTAMQENYLTAFECLTVIESADEVGSREEIEQSLKQLAEYIEANQDKDNFPVIQSIWQDLRNKLIG